MTVEWFDLAQRLAAAQAGRPVSRLQHSAVPQVARPVAVRAAVRGEQVTVAACVPGHSLRTERGVEALRMLGNMGVRVSGERCALLTDDTATLPALMRLARSAPREGCEADVAAHIGWWADRADFPGSSAVVPLLSACRTRWVTGEAPTAERHAGTWRAWLHVDDESVAGLLNMFDHLCVGATLPLLESIGRDDDYSWHGACRAHADGWDWRIPDTLSRAASGLRSRCDTADLWAAALLDDALYRRRAVHTGHVVRGVIGTTRARNKVEVICDRMDARLRAGSSMVGWSEAGSVGERFSGGVSKTSAAGGRLMLDLTVTGADLPISGARVTLIPAPPNVYQNAKGRSQYRSLYSTRSSWLTTGRTPVPQRRDVPLDVLLAGASDD